MKTLLISTFALAAIALITSGIYLVHDDSPTADSAITAPNVENPAIKGPNSTPTESSSDKTHFPGDGNAPSLTSVDPFPKTPDTARVAAERNVETFLTSTELHKLHTQLLERFANGLQPDIDESIDVRSLGLDRSQTYQLFLEPEDEIVLINDIPVDELANNPAVGSMLAGPTMKLAVQRGLDVFEIDLKSY